MPTSSYKKIGRVLAVLDQITPPTSVLDIGPGFGKYGVLLREHLDVRKGRYEQERWATRIDCVEAWEEYITPLHLFVYDHVYRKDVKDLLPELGQYDLIVMSDVIEHMPKEEGKQVLDKLYHEHCRKGMVVSYPNVIGSNWKTWENPYEKHHCIWSKEDFQEPEFDRVIFNSPQVVYLLKEPRNG